MFSLISHGWRSWKNAKGMAVLAALALAIGIASATTIFTVINAVMLRPLPYSEDGRWVSLLGGSTVGTENDRYSGLSLEDLLAYQQRTHSFDVLGWYTIGGDYNLTSPGAPQHIRGVEVTPSLIGNVGVWPVTGRVFRDSDGPHVAVISKRLWERLGAGSGIVGGSITLNGELYTVTGVMPPWFQLPIVGVDREDPHNDVWVPVKPIQDAAQRRGYGIFASYARLKPGVTVAQGRADARRVASEIAKEDPVNHRAYTAAVFSLRESVVRKIRPILLLLFGAAGLLFLITCANVAGLLVARSVGRARETAIRVALGGGQRQLATQFFAEGLLVSVAAAALGILASILLVHIVVSIATSYIPRADEVSVDWTVLLFTVGVGLLAAVLAALAPLWQALRIQPNDVLSDGVRASAGTRSRRLSQALVVGEIALAFTLLSVSALLLSQLRNLNQTSPGFDPGHLFAFQLNLTLSQYPNGEALAAHEDRLLQAVQTIPGVKDAAVANQLPLAGCCFGSNFFPEGSAVDSVSASPVSLMIVTSGYFKTMSIPLHRGRFLTDRDTNEKLLSVVIDEAVVKRYWHGGNALGALAHLMAPNGPPVQVVGIVGNVLNEGLGQQSRPEVYFLNTLAPVNPMQFVVRSNLATSSLVPAIRRAIRNVDPAQPIYAVRGLNEVIAGSLSLQRLSSVVITFFALAALLMASLGVYGVTSYSVRQRTAEIGTRMALGAIGRDLLWLIVGGGLRMALYGVAIGAVAVAVATWLMVRFFGVHEVSPLPYVYAVILVSGVAMLASLFPAWRATLLSPMVAIRSEPDSFWASARHGIQQVLSRGVEPYGKPLVDSSLLTEFIEASRRSESFAEVLRIALGTLAGKLKAESVMLLQSDFAQQYRCMAAAPERASGSFEIPVNGFLQSRLRFYASPLAFTSDDLETSLRWAAEQRPQYTAEVETLVQNRIRLAVALRTKHEILGLLLFGPPVGREFYSSSEKALARACAEQFALMMENARLTGRVVEQEKLRLDLELAGEVQKRLLPDKAPDIAGSAIEAFTVPVRSIGGDYYDFFQVGEHSIAIALADVAGKGIAAALIMSVVHASLRIIASEGKISLPELAARMNRFLHRSTKSNSYATFFYAEMDEEKHQLRYVNAGHNPPFLIRSTDRASAPIEELTTGGMVIGLFPFGDYEQATVDLHPGDVLLVFTDGVTEALNEGEEEFGEQRLKDLLRRVAHLPVKEMTAAISGELRNWIAAAPQHDDLTFIVMKVNA